MVPLVLLYTERGEREVVVVFLEGVKAKNDAVHWVQNYGTVKNEEVVLHQPMLIKHP